MNYLPSISQKTESRAKRIPLKVFMVAALWTIGVLPACNSSSGKVDNAKKEVERAQRELDIAQDQYAKDVAEFRKTANDKIATLEKEISLLQMKFELNKAEAGPDYEKRMLQLTERKELLKKKIADYKADNKDKWADFKREFVNDMDALGVALRNFNKPKS